MPNVFKQKLQSGFATDSNAFGNDIFISYSRKDTDFVRQLYQLLTE